MKSSHSITLSSAQMLQMETHVSDEVPLEACGLVGGESGIALEIFPTDNILASPSRYQIDPQAQLHIFSVLDERGWDLQAIYHSHPGGPSSPSITDIAEAAYPGAISLIWSRSNSNWQCNAFIISSSQFREIPITVADGK